MDDENLLYHFTPRTLPGPGVGNYVFELPYHLPYQPLRGEGLQNMFQFRTMQSPQIYKDQYKGPTYGYGGLQAGTIVGQPLLDDQASNMYTSGG
jgi:hypothetical protein